MENFEEARGPWSTAFILKRQKRDFDRRGYLKGLGNSASSLIVEIAGTIIQLPGIMSRLPEAPLVLEHQVGKFIAQNT